MVYMHEDAQTLQTRIQFEKIAEESAQKSYNIGHDDGYQAALLDIKEKIDEEYFDGGYGDCHDVEMIVRMIDELAAKNDVVLEEHEYE